MRPVVVLLTLWLVTFGPATWADSASVFLEELTWTEVRDATRAGQA